MSSSFAGGTVAIIMSYLTCNGKFEVLMTINGIVGSLVSISAGVLIFWKKILKKIIWETNFGKIFELVHTFL